MPGTPRVEQKTQETPTGDKIEIDKFSVAPNGHTEGLFIICSVRFPEAVAARLGGTNGLLQIGRKDELSTMSVVHAQLKSEQQIVLRGCPGLELRAFLPPSWVVCWSAGLRPGSLAWCLQAKHPAPNIR